MKLILIIVLIGLSACATSSKILKGFGRGLSGQKTYQTSCTTTQTINGSQTDCETN